MKPMFTILAEGLHIIDLQKTVVRANKAADFVKEIAANRGRLILLVQKQAIGTNPRLLLNVVNTVAKRWLGGMMTNFETIKSSIDRLRKIDTMKEKGEFNYLTKKERAKLEKEYLRLTEFLSGIRDMKEMPSAMFVVDLP